MDLKDMPIYFRRYKICREHMSVPVIIIDDVVQRFCQQCGRFHELTAFKGTQKTCETRLSLHNARRRANYAAKAKGRADQPATSQRGSGGVEEEGVGVLTDGTDAGSPSNKVTSQAHKSTKYASAPTVTGKSTLSYQGGNQPEKSSSSPPPATMTSNDVQEEEKVVLTVSELMNLIQVVASYTQPGNVNNSIHCSNSMPSAAAPTNPALLPLALPPAAAPAVPAMASETQQQAGLMEQLQSNLLLPVPPPPSLEQQHQTREEQSNAAAQLKMLAQLLGTLQEQQDKGDGGGDVC